MDALQPGGQLVDRPLVRGLDGRGELLSAGVCDAQGKASPRTLADMMGGTLPGELSRLDVRTDLSLDGG